MTSNELKPCRCCGYSARPDLVKTQRKHFDAHAFECSRCLFKPETKASLEEARTAWNTRAKVETPEMADSINWGNFASYLLDKCEGEIITEEFLQLALVRMSIDPSYNTHARAAVDPSHEGPARYWLIEQPDLDEDDDYKVIHTTDLDCYPEAVIIGEYVRLDVAPVQVVDGLEGALSIWDSAMAQSDIIYGPKEGKPTSLLDPIIKAARIQLQRQKGE